MRKAITTTSFVIGYVITNSFLPVPPDSRAKLLSLHSLDEAAEEIHQTRPSNETAVKPVLLTADVVESEEDIQTIELDDIHIYEDASSDIGALADEGSDVLDPVELSADMGTEIESVEVVPVNEVPVPVQAVSETPANLQRFYTALHELEQGARRHVHVVHYGDSEIAGDGVTRSLRKIWGERFGNGGLGFSLAARPFPTYYRDGYGHRKPLGFIPIPYTRKSAEGSSFGPGGVIFETWGKGAQATVDLKGVPEEVGCTVSFYYLSKSGKGALELSDTKTVFRSFKISQGKPGVRRIDQRFNRCPQRLRVVSTKAGRTQLYGWSVRYDQPGILWSSMGVLSAQLSYLNRYEPGNFGSSIEALSPSPDLLVLAYGLNIGSWKSIPGNNYKSRITASLQMVRKEAGQVDCLMMGPYPIGRFKAGRVITSPAAIAANRIQSQVAEEQGCHYMDRFELAGGPKATNRWLNGKPKRLSSDYVHMTRAGGVAMATDISKVLLRDYESASSASKVPASMGNE